MKRDLNGAKIATFCRKIAKITQRHGPLPPKLPLWYAGVTSVYSARDLNWTIFVQKIKQILVQASSQQGPGCASGRIHSCRQIF